MKGLIRWFVDNPIASNLLMFALLGLGLMSISTTKQEMFPGILPNYVTVSVLHQGAVPEQVEESICVKVEEALDGVDGIIKMKSTASEGMGMVLIEYEEDADKTKILRDIKDKVDAISTFPADAERPVVKATEFRSPVLTVAIYGEANSPLALRRMADQVKDEITAMSSVSSVNVVDSKTFEVTIEIDDAKLTEYGLTRDSVANAIRASSINYSAGTLRTDSFGEILIRTNRKAYVSADFETIVVHQEPNGLTITLGQIAKIRDGFAVFDEYIDFNGKPAVMLTVFQVGEQSVPVIADAVKQYVKERNDTMPESFEMSIWKDMSLMLVGRRELMIDNGMLGLALVFVILTLFLKLSLALWVTVGLSTAMIGTFWIMPQFGQSINMMSLFSFIVVLGILVDDAIVVAENIWYHRKNLKKSGAAAAKDGTTEMMLPVILAVATTIAAFFPMMTAKGTMGQFTRVIPIVVVMALALSLVEALLILPAHLAHVSPQDKKYRIWDPRGWIEKLRGIVSGLLDTLISKTYKPTLALAVRFRYLTICISVLILSVAIGLFAGGLVKWEFFPSIDGDNIVANLDMPVGTKASDTKREIIRIQKIAEEIVEETRVEHGLDTLLLHSMVVVGFKPQEVESDWETGGASGGGTQGNVAEVNIQILPAEERGDGIPTKELLDEWRRRVGEVPGATKLVFKADVSGSAEAINILLMSDDEETLRKARDEVREHLFNLPGVYDITDDMLPGKLELHPRLLEEGRIKGLTHLELIRQIRQGLFGEQTAREQRGRDDVRVKIRLPEADRERISAIENMKIRLPDGSEVDFSTVAELPAPVRGTSAIKRADRTRSVSITAEVSSAISANDVNTQLQNEVLPGIVGQYSGLRFRLEGQHEQQSRTMGDMAIGGIMTIFLIFTILALAFKSWVQPFIVMTAIPFGIAGAIFGHVIYGATFSLLSAIGTMAMAGVVVNGSLILIDFANRATADGVSKIDAILEAGPRRFRAIFITSLTTFAGLAPMLLEKSLQAQFLIPMAISLGFGVLFSSGIILVVVPALFMVVEDVKRVFAAYKRALVGAPAADHSHEVDIPEEVAVAGSGGARDSIFETVTASDQVTTIRIPAKSERPTAQVTRDGAPIADTENVRDAKAQGLIPDHLKDDKQD